MEALEYQLGTRDTAFPYEDAVDRMLGRTGVFDEAQELQSILRLSYCGLKLAGEAGEVTEKIGKLIRDEFGEVSPEFANTIEKELGDVLWYVARIADELGINLNSVMRANLDKLADRKERGVLGGSGDDR